MKNSNKGFTLVELSIVLVIIGLLIGGLLVAQSLIGSTRMQSAIRQLGQFDASVATFYSKFNQIPGDASVIGAVAGDNDSIIEDTAGTGANFEGETGKFWADLSSTGLKTTGTAANYTDCSADTGTCDDGYTAGTIVNTFIPKFPVGNNVGVIASGHTAGGAGTSGINYYWISSYATTAADPAVITTTEASALTGAEGVAVDAKLDDGSATAGNIRGVTTNLGGAITGTAYDTTTTTPTTSLVVRVGVQTGNLQ